MITRDQKFPAVFCNFKQFPVFGNYFLFSETTSGFCLCQQSGFENWEKSKFWRSRSCVFSNLHAVFTADLDTIFFTFICWIFYLQNIWYLCENKIIDVSMARKWVLYTKIIFLVLYFLLNFHKIWNINIWGLICINHAWFSLKKLLS